jgi:hypothetical protein
MAFGRTARTVRQLDQGADMSTHPSHTSPTSVFHEFDASVERSLGVDARLLYGMVVPILMICGLIILLALDPQTWLVIAVLLLEVAALGIVITGFVGMLNEDDEDDTATP